jgi:hypothetical protein
MSAAGKASKSSYQPKLADGGRNSGDRSVSVRLDNHTLTINEVLAFDNWYSPEHDASRTITRADKPAQRH